MATFTLTPPSYGKVVGRFVVAIGDGVDADVYPDGMAATGTVTFTPSASKVLVASGQPDPFTFELQPVTATLDSSGYLTFNNATGVWLVATNDTNTNPTGFTYSVQYNITYSGGLIDKSKFDIAVPASSLADSSTWTDLTKAAPVPSSTGTAIVQGPAGPAGPANTLTIGAVTTGTAAASITGSSPNQVLNLTLPSGGSGTVKTVAGKSPDSAGNVALVPGDVGAYPQPVSGIPKTDLASTVQASLTKADSATQNGYILPAGGIPLGTLTTTVQASLGRADTSVQQADGIVYVRRYSSGAWPVRGTVPTSSVVEWIGPTPPPIDGTYALTGVDIYSATVS